MSYQIFEIGKQAKPIAEKTLSTYKTFIRLFNTVL